ncbi:uncharacterized protein LOC107818730 [Nicotiana tabacum]|uniref:Uncharacterized protein LOC107818730 n=2 Tax=Nicotiana tabacum TaxID=4097 RepID=A0AC58TTY5_TOBAC
MHFQKRTFINSRMADISQAGVDYVNCATLVRSATYESASPEIHELNARLVDGEKYATIVDEVFDKNPQSNEPVVHSQFSKDEAQLVPLVGRDYFMPQEIEQFEILSIDSEGLLDAMKINSDSDDGKSEEDQRGCTKVEENSSNTAAQVFATNTTTQLSHIATMILDPFSSLIPDVKFPVGRILVVPVSVNLDDCRMLDTCYCCQTRACASLHYVSRSTIGTILFYSCVDNWFDTGQDFKADVYVLLSVQSEDLTHILHEEPWLLLFLSCEFVLQHDKKFTMANEVIVLSCIVLHLEWLVWQIVEVVGISNISYSCDAIGLLVRRGNLEYHSGPSSSEDMFSMHLVLELWAGGDLFDGTIALGYSLVKETTDIFGQLLTVVRNYHFMGDDRWNQSLAGHSGKVYPQRGLELAQRLEELPCTLSACICDQFIKRSTFDSCSALDHATPLIDLHQFFLDQFGL